MAEPITDQELRALFAPTLSFKAVVLAVSGGSDSMALLLLMRRWAGLVGIAAPEVEVVTLDHGLRAGSADEARQVALQSQRLGFHHTTQVWAGEKEDAGLQARARSARYRLLAEVVAARNLPRPAAIVTAHNKDDQAETFLMRLARGSGPDGLAAMQTLGKVPGFSGAASEGISLLRPLLSVERARLRSTLTEAGMTWIEDPSNESRAFERVRVRDAAPLLEEIGLTKDMLALAAMRQARARGALQTWASRVVGEEVDHHEGAFARMARERFAALPEEIQIRVLMLLLGLHGGRSTPARLMQVERLRADLAEAENLTVTVGGCIIVATGATLDIFREPGREGLEAITIRAGETRVWDNRFIVSLERQGGQPHGGFVELGAGQPVEVAALGAEGVHEIKATQAAYGSGRMVSGSGLPRRAQLTLPAFRVGGRLIWSGLSARCGRDSEGRNGVGDRQIVADRGVSDGQGPCRAHFIGLP